jgi:hypothetical protein
MKLETGMSPLMRELCAYYVQVWRKEHEFEPNLDEAEIIKRFVQSAVEAGWARMAKSDQGEHRWEQTPKVFSDIGGTIRSPRRVAEEVKEIREPSGIQISRTKKLVYELDNIADRLICTCDEMSAALEWIGELRQVAFHLLAAVGEDPIEFQYRKAAVSEQDERKPLA